MVEKKNGKIGGKFIDGSVHIYSMLKLDGLIIDTTYLSP